MGGIPLEVVEVDLRSPDLGGQAPQFRPVSCERNLQPLLALAELSELAFEPLGLICAREWHTRASLGHLPRRLKVACPSWLMSYFWRWLD